MPKTPRGGKEAQRERNRENNMIQYIKPESRKVNRGRRLHEWGGDQGEAVGKKINTDKANTP